MTDELTKEQALHNLYQASRMASMNSLQHELCLQSFQKIQKAFFESENQKNISKNENN